MAGVTAGRLNIEIIAEVARLQADMDKVKRAVRDASNDIAKSAKSANDNLGNFSRTGATVNKSTGQMRSGMQQLSYQIGDVSQQFALGVKPQIIFAQQSGQVIQALQLMAGTSKGFIGFLAGPWGIALTAAAVVLTPMVAKLLEAEDATKKVEFASYGLKDAQSVLGSIIDLTTGKVKDQSSALYGLAKAQILVNQIQAQARLDQANQKIQASKGFTTAPALGGPFRAFDFMFGSDTPAQQKQIASQFLNGVIDSAQAVEQLKALQEAGQITKTEFNELAASYANASVEVANIKVWQDAEKALNGDTKALQQFLDTKDKSKTKSDKHAESLARESRAIEAQIAKLNMLADAYLKGDQAALKAEITAKAIEQGIRKRADVEAYVAQQIRLKVAERTADAAKDVAAMREQTDTLAVLNNQVEQGLITSDEANQLLKDEAALRPYVQAAAIAEGDAKEKLAEIIKTLRDEQKRSNDEAKRAQDLRRSEGINFNTEQLKQEIQLTDRLGKERIAALKGLSGVPLEEELARIDAERQKGLITIKAEADAARDRANGLTKSAEATLANAEAQKQLIDLEAKFDAEARAAGRLAQQVDALASAMANLGGIGGSIGSLIGALKSGDPASALLGMGGAGSLAGLLLATGALQKLGAGVSGGLQGLGLGAGLSGALGAGLVGFGAGGLVYGAGRTLGLGKGASLGAGIGAGTAVGVGALASSGALGFGATQAFLSTVGGPIGIAIAAGLGLLAGGVLSPTKRGGATFGGSGADLGISNIWGNSQSRVDTSVDLAGQVLGTLQQLADALGAELGTFTGSISQRGKNLRYDPTGQGISKTSKGALDFGQDEAALLSAAIKDAISDGVFEGLSEGFADYLENGAGDIEQRVQDLLDVTGIRKVVEAFKDPLGAALKEFDAQAQQYRDLYEKVGVSAQETADLENYLADTRQALIDQYSTASEDDRRVRELEIEIMQLQGREQEALNAQRELEKEGVSEAVAALLDHRNALLDEAAAAQQAAAVQQEAQSLQIRLQQALGNSEEVLRLQREAELAAVDPLNRALLQSVYAAEDAARAQQQLAAAQQQAAQSAQSAASALASGGAGAVTDPLIGGAVSALINGTTTLTAAAEQIKATFQTQATAAFPNDAAAATNFYNSLINGLSASTAANQRASGPPVGGVDVLNYQPGNAGAPGNGGFDNHAGRGNRQFATPLDAMKAALLDAGGRQLWAQWLMGGAGSGDLPGWGGFSEGIRGMQRLLRDYGAGFVGSKALDGGGGRRLSDEGKAALSQAYEREKSEIEGVIDEFSSLRDSLMEYRDSLELVGKTQADTYAILRRRFLETAGLARSGDKEALGELQGAGQAFLGAAARNAQTTVGFRKEVAFVQSYLDQAIGATGEVVDYNEEQLAALEKSVQGQIEIKEAVLTVADILKGIRGDNSDYRREQQAENIAVAKKTGETAKTLDRVSQNGTSLRVDLTV